MSVSLAVAFAFLFGAGAGAVIVAHWPGSHADAAKAGYRTAQAAPAAVAGLNPQKPVQAWIVGSAPLSDAARPASLLASRADLDCLADAVYYEARGESVEGQAAVAQVVLNRARQPGFPKSVCGVVFQGSRGGGCQFSFACDGAMNRPVESSAWDRAHIVAARALSGYVMTAVGSSVQFHATHTAWQDGAVARIGGHVFLDHQPPSATAVRYDAGLRYAALGVRYAPRGGTRGQAAGADAAEKIATALDKDFPEPPPTPERASD